MFKVDDYIMYGMTGVCKVKDIENRKNRAREEKQYYVLNPISSNTTVIRIPVDNEIIIMRPILSKEEVNDLIYSISDNEDQWAEALWIEDERERSKDFNLALKSCNCNEWIKLITTICSKKKEKKVEGKKLATSDDNVMKAAEKLLNEEFSVILNITPEEVPSYIANNIG